MINGLKNVRKSINLSINLSLHCWRKETVRNYVFVYFLKQHWMLLNRKLVISNQLAMNSLVKRFPFMKKRYQILKSRPYVCCWSLQLLRTLNSIILKILLHFEINVALIAVCILNHLSTSTWFVIMLSRLSR